MRAIILAAGKGKRLDKVCGDLPKCLLDIGGLSLIERQIEALQAIGVDEITAVVGYGAERVRERCGSRISYIENEIHDQTNSLYSLWLARHVLTKGFVVLNADVLFHSQLLVDLISVEYEDALLIDYCDHDTTYGEEEMKVRVRRGCVADISKVMEPAEADGENVGIARFGADGARLLTEEMDALVAASEFKAWVPRAFKRFAARRPLHVIGTRGLPWIEIDFPEDYRRAVDVVLPQIEGAAAGTVVSTGVSGTGVSAPRIARTA